MSETSEVNLLLAGIKDAVNQIYSQLYPASDYRIVALLSVKEEHLRFYRVHKVDLANTISSRPADFSLAVLSQDKCAALCVDRETNKVQIGYGRVGRNSVMKEMVAALNYGAHESQKVYRHIIDYLVYATVPVADGE
jgi:hypothetical protein